MNVKIKKKQKQYGQLKNFKNRKSEHVLLGSKMYLGPRDPIIGSMGYGGRGV